MAAADSLPCQAAPCCREACDVAREDLAATASDGDDDDGGDASLIPTQSLNDDLPAMLGMSASGWQID